MAVSWNFEAVKLVRTTAFASRRWTKRTLFPAGTVARNPLDVNAKVEGRDRAFRTRMHSLGVGWLPPQRVCFLEQRPSEFAHVPRL